RDRVCSEWISQEDCRPIWDPDLGQYRNSCAGLMLCEEYDESGVVSCKRPKFDDADIVITPDVYASRDVSWYGHDYSGHTIPGQFFMHNLAQEQVAPVRVCQTPGQP